MRCCEKRLGYLLNACRVASLGREVFVLVVGWSPLVAKHVSVICFGSWNQSEMAVLSQFIQSLVVKHNKQFKQIHNACRSAF